MRGRLEKRTWEYNPAHYAPPKYRRACHYEAFIPEEIAAWQEPLAAEVAGIISEAEKAIHQLNAGSQRALAPLARLLLRSESIASSKIEGMQVDVRALARAEAKIERGARVGVTVHEVLANVDAMELAIEHATNVENFSVANIVEIHTLLMENAHNRHVAGQIRGEQNWIGGNEFNPCGADFVPPPPEEVQRLLEDIATAINDDSLPPIVQAGLVHAQFETIHPFHDGNGRTGRALIHVVLHRRGVTPRFVPPISVVLAAKKDRYIAGLTAFRTGDTTSWLTTFASAAAQSAILASGYLREVELLKESWREELKGSINPRSDALAWEMIELLPGYPIITVPIVVAATGRSKGVVGEAMRQLASVGILNRTSESKSNRAWEAKGLLDMLGDLESGVSPTSVGLAENTARPSN